MACPVRHAAQQALPRLRETTPVISVTLYQNQASMVGGRLPVRELRRRGHGRREGRARDRFKTNIDCHRDWLAYACRRFGYCSPQSAVSTVAVTEESGHTEWKGNESEPTSTKGTLLYLAC